MSNPSPHCSNCTNMSSQSDESYQSAQSQSCEGSSRLSATNEEAYSNDPKLEEDPHFIQKYFVAVDTIPNMEDDSITQSIKDIFLAHEEIDTRPDFVKVFNQIAQFACTIAIGRNSSSTPLHFLCSSDIGPSTKNSQQTRDFAPAILVLPPFKDISQVFLRKIESEFKNDGSSFCCPWPILESMIAVEPKGEWNIKRPFGYLETILQHRPDKVNVFGVTCNQTGYRFYYMDACTQKISMQFEWDEGLMNLVHYVYSLHRIYEENIGRDKSFRLHDIVSKNNYNSAIWEISSESENYRIQPIFETGRGRRTWVGVGTVKHTTSAVRVVKDMWRDNSGRYEEANLLQRIHENGFIPGVVRLVSDATFDDLTAGNRTKHRLVMGSTGLRLSACKSVLEFLKVIYDAVEAHEQVAARGVLHRDISWFNVLCKPQHYIGNDKVLSHPNIGKILGEADSHPLCLLTDFDNAALMQDLKDPKEGTQIGTPMFMACELAYENYGYNRLRASKLEPQPPVTLSQLSLEGEVLEKYIKLYGRERYDEFDKRLSSVLSGLVEEVDPFAAGNFVPPHRPHHDMESIFWIIVRFIAKSWPVGTDPYPGIYELGQKGLLWSMHSRMYTYDEISDGVYDLGQKSLLWSMRPRRNTYDEISDIVLEIVTCGYDIWKVNLHPTFRCLTRMLSDMGDYIRMCWSRFPDMPYWHSHEAFKRLLLKEIIRMTNDNTPILIQGPRPPIPRPFNVYGKTLKWTVRSPLTLPNGAQSRGDESTNAKRTFKRPRSNSIPADSGSIAKKRCFGLSAV